MKVKKTILYATVAATIAAIAVMIAVMGCNTGDGGTNDSLNRFIGSFATNGGDNPGETEEYCLTVIASPTNWGKVSTTGGCYEAGRNVTVTAESNENCTFTGWTDETGASVSPDETVTITMDTKNKILFANFRQKDGPTDIYTLSTGIIPTTGGTISLSSQQDTYNAGDQVTATANPNQNYKFTAWSGAVYSTERTVTIKMEGDEKNKTLIANFEAVTVETKKYTLTVNADPIGGSVTKAPNQNEYDAGTKVTVTATPNDGYMFTGWTGALTSTNLSVEINMNENKELTANFVLGDTPPGDGLQSCNSYCYFGNDGCTELKIDPTGQYYSDGGRYEPRPINNCTEADSLCSIDGGGLYTDAQCKELKPGLPEPNEYCGVYCVWEDGNCYELKTDKRAEFGGEYAKVMNVCFDDLHPRNDWSVVNNCRLYSPPEQTFSSRSECERYVENNPWTFSSPPGALLKTSAGLRAYYTSGAVEITLTATKISGGNAELINPATGATVSSADVIVKGKKITATLPVGADIPAGYYDIRVTIRDADGKQFVEEKSIGIVK